MTQPKQRPSDPVSGTQAGNIPGTTAQTGTNPASPLSNEVDDAADNERGGGAEPEIAKLPGKLTRYIGLGIVAAMLPFGLELLIRQSDPGHTFKSAFAAFMLFRKGELCLISMGIGLAAAGELHASKQRYMGKARNLLECVRQVCFWGCVICAIAEVALYGWAHSQPDTFNGAFSTRYSIELFWSSSLLGIGCIVLSEY